MKKKIVIIGGVAVGASCAARLRRLNEEDEIILLEKDEHISFANCGLPYFVGDVIKDRSNLIIETRESLKSRFNIDVRNFSEATKINREKKSVEVFNKQKNESYDLSYDKLVLAMGASSIVPNFNGLEQANNIFTLRTVPDSESIKEYVAKHDVKNAVVIGAGFIGLEAAENLVEVGVKPTVLDLSSQVLNVVDEEIAKLVENEMVEKGVNIKLGTSVDTFKDEGKELLLTNGETIKTDLTIMAIGVKPNIKIAKEAGLEIGKTNGVKVDDFLITNDPDIYAGGDLIEVKNYITKEAALIPLAGPANRHGRLIADHINGIHTPTLGSLGSSVIKIFDKTVASTGLTEKAALKANCNYKTIHIHRPNHATYYPGASMITLKLVFDVPTRKVLGAQAFGESGVEKRIDVIATALKFCATVDDLAGLELTYAPPFSSAKDPVNIAGYAAGNVLNQDYIPFYIQELDDLLEKKIQFYDVRTVEEYDYGHIEGSKNFPLDDIRDNLDKIDFNKDIYITCQVGHRGYLAAKLLKENGFSKKIYNLSGGYKLYKETR
ncbi:MAG: FAD-dependent oxidoreductase [Erysipelotrichales bacterium]